MARWSSQKGCIRVKNLVAGGTTVLAPTLSPGPLLQSPVPKLSGAEDQPTDEGDRGQCQSPQR